VTGKDLQDFTNSLGSSGHLKRWKADAIVYEVALFDMTNDNVRLFRYLENALEMEGFNQTAIEKIAQYLKGNF
jgi:hypothetical protein